MSHIVKILVPTNSTFQKMHAVRTRKMITGLRHALGVSRACVALLLRHFNPC
jgi:hypothetical protein